MTPPRRLLLLPAAWLCLTASLLRAASGQDCASAIPATAAAEPSSQVHVMQDRTLWFRFTAQLPQVRVTVEGPDYGSGGGHIHRLRLHGGTCGNLVLLADRELAWAPTQSRLQIDLEAGLLVPGQDYYVELLRDPAQGACPKSSCAAASGVPVELTLQGHDLLLPPDPAPPAQAHAYEENRGQLLGTDGQPVPEIAFYTISGAPSVYAAPGRASLVWSHHDTTPGMPDAVHRVDLRLVGSDPGDWLKTEAAPGHSNYYLGHIPDGVERNHAYARLVMPQAYPGVDWQLYSDAAGLKQYFVVAPHNEAGQIALAFDGADNVALRPDGGLVVHSALGDLSWAPAELALHDPVNGLQHLGQARFVDQGGSFGLDLPTYPAEYSLVITIHGDPLPLTPAAVLPAWGTFYGGAEGDACLGMDTDELGNVYAAGETYSWDFPLFLNSQPIPPPFAGNKDAYVSRFNEYYVRGFTTWIGGDETDGAAEVDVDAVSGRVYICGITESSAQPMPNYVSAITYYNQTYPFGTNSGFLAGFERMGGTREWVTKFGSDQSAAFALETDQTGDIYLVGATYETKLKPTSQPTPGLGFPITAMPGAFLQNATNLSPNGNPEGDAYIARFSRYGTLEWSTIFGGNRNDAFYDIAIDNFYGHVYAVGGWKSQHLGGSNGNLMPCAYAPLVPANGYHQALLDGQANATSNPGDGLIARFSLGGALQWSTLYGGSGWDGISSVVVEGQSPGIVPTGTVYLTGFTNTPAYGSNCTSPTAGGFPGCGNGIRYQQPYGGGPDDAFIARFERSTQLTWATYLGGAGRDGYKLSGNCPGPKIAAMPGDRIYVAGSTTSGSSGLAPITTQPNGSYYEQLAHADPGGATARYDGYILGFNGYDLLEYAGYLGGQGGDYNQAVAANYDKVFVGGAVLGNAGYPLYNPVSLPGTAWFQGYPVSGGEGHYAQILTSVPTAQAVPLAQADALLLSPNPTSGRLDIQAPWTGAVDVEVMDALGHVLLQRSTDIDGTAKLSLDLADLPAGLYLLRCIHPDGTATGKFVKR